MKEPEEPEIDGREMTNDKENNVDKRNENEHSKTSAEIPQKQKLKTFDAVLDGNNYEGTPPQGDFTFEYKDSKKTIKTAYKSKKMKVLINQVVRAFIKTILVGVLA